jgi:hypothetical protein
MCSQSCSVVWPGCRNVVSTPLGAKKTTTGKYNVRGRNSIAAAVNPAVVATTRSGINLRST